MTENELRSLDAALLLAQEACLRRARALLDDRYELGAAHAFDAALEALRSGQLEAIVAWTVDDERITEGSALGAPAANTEGGRR